MSLNNGQLHGFAFVGTIVVAGSLLAATVYLSQATGRAEPGPPPLQEMITIEASLARKSTKQRQPQKELKTPEPPAKPEGVSRDETKAPVEKPKEERKPPRTEEKLDISKFRRPSDDEPQSGAPTTDIGQFDGSIKGFAPVNTGDPYWGELNADIRQLWEIPEISRVTGEAQLCLHIEPDGKIAGIRTEKPSGDDIVDDSAMRAMKALQKARNAKPVPVPIEQLRVIKGWVCFRFNPAQ